MGAIDRKINRTNISKNDFEVAIGYLSELDSVAEGSLAYEALWMMSIISYCRPFTDNELDGKSKAASKVEMPRMTEDEQKLHDVLMLIRNKVIAHSEMSTNPTSIDDSNGTIWRRRFGIWGILQEYENLKKDKVFALADKMLKHCHNKFCDLRKTKGRVLVS